MSQDDYDDAKGSGGGGGGGGGGGRRKALLMDVAAEADMSLFGGSSELMIWVGEHCDEWADAVAGEEDGSGSPIKQMARWKSLHVSTGGQEAQCFHPVFCLSNDLT